MHKYVICGPQGSGKGTQSELLCRDYDLVHISIGEMFRWNVKHHTKLAARIKRITDAGLLVPDEIVERVVRERLDQQARRAFKSADTALSAHSHDVQRGRR